MTSSTIHVVDHDPAVHALVKRTLHGSAIVKTYLTTDRLLHDGRPDQPSCLILNLTPGDLRPLRFAEELPNRDIEMPVVFISSCREVRLIVRAMQIGAVDFLAKPLDPAALTAALRAALDVDAKRIQQRRLRGQIARRFATLSLREREVLFAVTDGMLNKQVAFDLGLSEKTIKVHRRHVMEKMGAESLPALVRMADAIRGIRMLLCEPAGSQLVAV